MQLLNNLRQFYTDLNDSNRLKKVNAAIGVLEELEKARIASANAQQKIDKAEIEKLLKNAKSVKSESNPELNVEGVSKESLPIVKPTTE